MEVVSAPGLGDYLIDKQAPENLRQDLAPQAGARGQAAAAQGNFLSQFLEEL
jgi:hypothetical protein